jgi:3-oxoacyl-[acyl-carrier protein] reductase
MSSTALCRVAIVTGGSRGIGREAAERLATDGLAVTVVYGGGKDEVNAVVDGIAERGGQAIAVQADVADQDAVTAAFDTIEQAFGGVDVVVHAVAPGHTATALFLDGKDEEAIDRLAKLNPMERLGTPTDIAEVVCFLAGPARWINGQTIYANGGMV